MKVWVVWGNNGEQYEDNCRDIWAICGSKEAAEQCITNARKQIRYDEERWNELVKITSNQDCINNRIEEELDKIESRRYLIPYSRRGKDGLPYFSIREYDVIN